MSVGRSVGQLDDWICCGAAAHSINQIVGRITARNLGIAG